MSNLRNEQKPGVDNGSKENRRDATAGQTQHTRIPADLINLPVAEQLKISSDYIEGDKFEAAHQLLSLVIEKTNDPLLKSEVKFKRASLALHYMDRPEHALADFIALIKESQDRAIVGDSHYFAGWIYYEKKNDLKNAVKHFQIVVETYPDNSNIGTARFFVDEASRRITGKGTK